jgi:hypothetical protein
LHAVQELWELLQDEVNLESSSEVDEPEIHVNMLLSQEAVGVGSSSKTLTFLGTIQGSEVIILVDSGSSNSFINAKLAPTLLGLSQLINPVRVQVVNGQILNCVLEI